MKEITIITTGSQDFNKIVLNNNSKIENTLIVDITREDIQKFLLLDFIEIYKDDDYSTAPNLFINTKQIIRIAY